MQAAERSLSELEGVIERGLGTFVEVGQALFVIRDARLYREMHATFEDYCRDRWGFTDRRARQLMQAAEIGTMVPISNERHARELARLPKPEAVREVWQEVQEEHGEQVTASDVREAVDRRLGTVRPAPSPPVVTPQTPETESGNLSPLGSFTGEPPTVQTGISRTSVLEQEVDCVRPLHQEPTRRTDSPAVQEGDSQPRQPASISVPNTQAIRDAHLASEFLHALRFATQIAAYAPDRIVAVLRTDDADATERSLERLGAWFDQYRQVRRAPLRVVGS